MFKALIEAIRFESSQSGGSKEKVPDQGKYSVGRMVWHAGKQKEKNLASKRRRRMGKRVAQER